MSVLPMVGFAGNRPFLICHPIKPPLNVVPKMGYLNINITNDSLHIPINRATNYQMEDPPIIEPIEETMATSVRESSDSDLEEDFFLRETRRGR